MSDDKVTMKELVTRMKASSRIRGKFEECRRLIESEERRRVVEIVSSLKPKRKSPGTNMLSEDHRVYEVLTKLEKKLEEVR